MNDSLLNTLGDAPDVPRVLVGSMKDLSDQRQVSHQVSEIVSRKFFAKAEVVADRYARFSCCPRRRHKNLQIRGVSLTLNALVKRASMLLKSFIPF